MDESVTDQSLLRAFAERGEENAFQELVRRHIDLVFATALRRLSDPTVAREVTQTVFLALARKAPLLAGEVSLAGWLHRTTVFETRLWWRGELRRQRREQTAVKLGTTMQEQDEATLAMASELDEALLELRDKDRQALMLRFFEERSHREIGALLGTGEDAARKRIDKALEKLTRFFRRRGYAVPAVAATAAVLQKAAQAAPAGLAGLVAQATVQQVGTASLSGLSLLLFKLMALTKTQTVVACLLVAAAPMGYQWKLHADLNRENTLLNDRLTQSRQTLADLRREGGELRTRANLASSDRPLTRTGTNSAASASTAQDPSLWSVNSPYVQVPRAVLAKIGVPSLDDRGLLSEDMARVLGLNAEQVAQANAALTNFTGRYQAWEQAHFQPSEEHPQSVGFGGTKEQRSFVREAFPEEYTRMIDQLQTSLESVVGVGNLGYVMTNASRGGHSEFDPSEAALDKRITIVRFDRENASDGPFGYGEEFRENGRWGMSARMGVAKDASELPLPMLRDVAAEWRKSASKP